MNYSEALSFTFEDEDWLKKIAIGGLFALISVYAGLVFIFGFFLVGYYIGVLRNTINGEEKPLPEWSDMGKIFVDGVLGTIIILINFIVIGGICAALICSVALDSFMPESEMVLSIIFISITTLVALTVAVNFGLMQFAATNNFGAAFSFSGFLQLLKSQLGTFIAISLFSFILNLILLCAGLAILSPFTNFWGMMVQAHLFGQCARQIYQVRPSLQSA